jgi:membrane protease YdiL (CAAX protease family)
MPATSPDISPASHKDRREPLVVFAALLLTLVGISTLSRVLPSLAPHQLGLVALAFLVLPRIALARTHRDPAAYGLTLRRAGRGVGIGLLASALILPPFAVVQHVWFLHIEGLRAAPSLHALRRAPDVWQRFSAPHAPPSAHPQLSADRERIDVAWAPDAHATLDVRWDGPVIDPRGRLLDPSGIHQTLAPGEAVRFSVLSRGATTIELDAAVEGVPLAASAWRSPHGAPSTPASPPAPLRIPLSFGWIGWMVLVQALLIALPEEFFFRGYLQRRLDELRPARRLWKRFPLTDTIVTVSLAFALTHLVFTFAVTRLAVFLPSLVFGLLRDRTGGIVASITFHAACNLFVEFTHPHYVFA